MPDFAASLVEFQHQFPDDGALRRGSIAARWPFGFRCPACAGAKGWPHGGKPFTFECAACGKQTSATAGTIMHGSKLPLIAWFWAVYLMATHSNGISALQLQKQLGLGSYKSAWSCCAPSCAAPWSRQAARRSPASSRSTRPRSCCEPRTIRFAAAAAARPKAKCSSPAPSKSKTTRPDAFAWPRSRTSPPPLHGLFVAANVAPGATLIKTDGWPSYARAPGVRHEPHVIGAMAAHVVLPGPPRLLQRQDLGAGVDHGLRRQHLQSYLDEFVFRFNLRRTRPAAFRSLLAIALVRKPLTYKMLIMPEAEG